MADGKFLIGKPAGGVTTVTMTDGASNTTLVLPESGTVATQAYVDDLKIIATGTATFTATTNNISLTGIGIGVEIGDVIQISGADDVKNNSEFTVEVITDADNIIVNQAHSNKGTTKNVAARASDTDVTVKLLAKWYNAPNGLGQDWVDVKTSRSAGTAYTNSTNRDIKVGIISTYAGHEQRILVDTKILAWQRNASSSHADMKADIPRGAIYKHEIIVGGTQSWSELR